MSMAVIGAIQRIVCRVPAAWRLPQHGVRCLAMSAALVDSPTSTIMTTEPVDREGRPRYKGATFDKGSGKWKSVITVNGKRIHLGTFDDAKLASDAYFAAKAVYSSEQYRRKEKRKDWKESSKVPAIRKEDGSDSDVDEPLPPFEAKAHEGFIGVFQDAAAPDMWEAIVTVNGKEISGGEYESAEMAAKAYDALARMYLGSTAKTNFPMDSYASWVPPDEIVNTGQIETKVGEKLTVDEIVKALNQERGINVTSINLAGKSDLADHMVFATGKNVPHMQKMADMLSRALRKRRLPGVDPTVEGRDMDDWMVVDAGNIIVNIMDAEAREVFDLENFYGNMQLGEDPYAGMTYDEWLEKNPIPEKWLRRLEKDELEIESRQRAAAPTKFKDDSGALPNLFHKGRRTKAHG